jgi:hypothetical protein
MKPVQLEAIISTLDALKTLKQFTNQEYRELAIKHGMPYRVSALPALINAKIIVKLEHGRYHFSGKATSSEAIKFLEIARNNQSRGVKKYESLSHLEDRLNKLGYELFPPKEEPTEEQLVKAFKALGYRIFQEK